MSLSYSNNVYVFAGFRDNSLKAKIEAKGGKVASRLVKSATHMIVKSLVKPLKKVAEAKERGLEIVMLDDFMVDVAAMEKMEILIVDESEMALLSKIVFSLVTDQGKNDAMKAMETLKIYLSV